MAITKLTRMQEVDTDNIHLSEADRKLVNCVQNHFPVCENPFAVIAAELRMPKEEVLSRLKQLQARGVFSRFGAVLNHRKLGKSLLAAMKVPEAKLEQTALLVNSFDAVNHNYLREHEFNLWFVVAAENEAIMEETIFAIEQQSGISVMRLPMEKAFQLNLAFAL